jgi:hypothetical protein
MLTREEALAEARLLQHSPDQEIERLKAERDAAVAMLRRLEWVEHDLNYDVPTCLMCAATKPNGHTSWCALAALLGAAC